MSVFGSATLVCFILQVITGVALSLLYQPSSEAAYQSLEFITDRAAFGHTLRGIHYFGASGMIIMIGIHMLRVYLLAAYKYPRELSWVSGVILLMLTIFMGFTGQLLRWDSNGVWSAVVAAQQLGRVPLIGTYLARLVLGGDTIGAQSLSRFFSYHVFIIPALLFTFIGFHLYLVLHHGISEPPKAGQKVDPKTYKAWYANLLKKEGAPFWPNAAWRDILFAASVILIIIGLAIVIGPPELTHPPDPSLVFTSPSPDWYMIPFFAAFALMPPSIESYVIFLGPIFVIFGLLALPFFSNKGERSPIRRPWAILGSICVVIFILSLLSIGLKEPWSPDFDTPPLTSIPKFQEPTLKAGATLFYNKGCQYCHQIEKTGGDVGPNLSQIGRTLTKAQLELKIINGGPDMPAFGGIVSKEELNTLSDFLSKLK
jgi:ubiquinol-cytochrome c reductase cytochrome b subunit